MRDWLPPARFLIGQTLRWWLEVVNEMTGFRAPHRDRGAGRRERVKLCSVSRMWSFIDIISVQYSRVVVLRCSPNYGNQPLEMAPPPPSSAAAAAGAAAAGAAASTAEAAAAAASASTAAAAAGVEAAAAGAASTAGAEAAPEAGGGGRRWGRRPRSVARQCSLPARRPPACRPHRQDGRERQPDHRACHGVACSA